jgi:hypothetical protein
VDLVHNIEEEVGEKMELYDLNEEEVLENVIIFFLDLNCFKLKKFIFKNNNFFIFFFFFFF